MKKIIFYDGVCPNPYTINTLYEQGLGGTEATVLRVAWELSNTHEVSIEQRHRERGMPHFGKPTLSYDSLNSGTTANIVITLRDAGHYIANKARFPHATHYLWLHDLVSGEYQSHLQHHLKDQQANIIAVSNFHRSNIVQGLYQECLKGNTRVSVIYNPVEPKLGVSYQELDKKKLVFFSSPHKGLDNVLKLFGYIRNIDPEFRLYIANPGYMADRGDLPEGVINLGSLPQKKIIEHVSGALCVFYPNLTFPETFGLVYAEANAVGTPVLAHPIGAAREILFHPHETMDCRDYKAVVDRVIKWSKGERPIVKAKKEYSLESVTKEWLKKISTGVSR